MTYILIPKAFGQNTVLQDITFSVNKGEFVSILGKSGCGKTTLLRLIIGLDENFDGNITLSKNTGTMGIVFQEHRLIPWLPVWENVAFALPEDISRIDKRAQSREILSLVGLEGYENAWIREISGGMAQRVALARALINLPDLLLLDEPFGALDSFTRMEMQQELKRIVQQQNIASIMVTHDVEEAISLSDRIIILGGSPTTVQHSFEISLKDRFDRTSTDFIDIRSNILKSL